MNRRDFLKYTALGFGSLFLGKIIFKKKFKGKLLGPSRIHGHKLRDYTFNKSNIISRQKHKVVIIGGGIAGLSAGWWLKRNGFEDFTLLELEKQIGGNSQSGPNYPWGAHYIPIANLDSEYQKILFEELGIIESYDVKSKLPIYNELFLCHEQEERLFKDGKWQNGLIPQYGLQENEKQEITKFLQIIQNFKSLKGSDQKPIFNIPLAFSSQDPKFLQLDKQSMESWLKQNNFKTKPLLWYINHCCHDDYGIGLDQVSAWAGLHYFASRRGLAANADYSDIITWPEGNGWIVKQLKNKLKSHLQTEKLAYKIQNINNKVQINYVNLPQNTQHILDCDYAICAAPHFIAKYIVSGLSPINNLKYIPWLTANIHLSYFDPEMAWDNVNYHSESLGYVLANHQQISTKQNKSIITYYSNLKPENRYLYQLKNHSQWAQEIVSDLQKIHPNINKYIENIDIWLWGHGMISPSIDFIWSKNRQEMQKPYKNIYFAHSDMSGISIFEEAQYQGVKAALAILNNYKNS